jgi:hypothetical protein
VRPAVAKPDRRLLAAPAAPLYNPAPRSWGGSSAGRALRSQCRGRGFDPLPLHQFPFSLVDTVLSRAYVERPGVASRDACFGVSIFWRNHMAARKKSAKTARRRSTKSKRRQVRRKVARTKRAVKARRVVRRASARVKAKSAVRKASRKAKRTVRKAARSARRNIRVAKRGARSAIRGTARNVRAATRKAENVANKLVSATAEKVESAAVAVDQSMAEPRPVPVSVAA